MKTFSESYFDETRLILSKISSLEVERLASVLADVRERGGRLFILGVGGSAGHASHAVNDFRKICGIECYAPTDNVSELTARANDEGWRTIFSAWLAGSRLSSLDGVLCFSVGGGSQEKNISVNIVDALEYAQKCGATIAGIVGRDGGAVAAMGSAVVIIPPLFESHVTPHTEGLTAVVWHLLVSHPRLQRSGTKWESYTLDHNERRPAL